MCFLRTVDRIVFTFTMGKKRSETVYATFLGPIQQNVFVFMQIVQLNVMLTTNLMISTTCAKNVLSCRRFVLVHWPFNVVVVCGRLFGVSNRYSVDYKKNNLCLL